MELARVVHPLEVRSKVVFFNFWFYVSMDFELDFDGEF